jgi:hypothetical protein
MSTLYFLNAPICHTPDLAYRTRRLTREEAIKLAAVAVSKGEAVSAIGHDGSAAVLSTLLDQHIAVNRVSMSYQPGDTAICLQLRSRQPEGVVLTAEQVEAIGYDLTLIETAPAPVLVIFGSAVEAARELAAGSTYVVMGKSVPFQRTMDKIASGEIKPDEGAGRMKVTEDGHLAWRELTTDTPRTPSDLDLYEAVASRTPRRPGDIDAIYGGMSADEARTLVNAWARSVGLADAFGLPLAIDLHPGLCSHQGPNYTGFADLGTRQDFPACYAVRIPHPAGTVLPDVVVLAGKPTVRSFPVTSLAAAIRQAAAECSTPQTAGDMIAKFIANTRNGLNTIVLNPHRGDDASYLETSLAGIRSAWAKLMAKLGETHLDRSRAHDAVVEHVDGYLAGVGVLLGRLVKGLSPASIARLRWESRDSTIEVFKRHGTLTVQRQPGAENIWIAGGGDLWEPAAVIARWLGDLGYSEPSKALRV